jgi:hypothetical protein
MRQEEHKKVEDLDSLRLTFVLVHHIAESREEAHESMGWEVKQLTFTLWPDSEEPGPSFTLAQPIATMEVVRQWIAAFNLHAIITMLTLYASIVSEGQMRLPFNAMLRSVDEWLQELDKVPSYPFAD